MAKSNATTLLSLGINQFWGYSPAFNLLDTAVEMDSQKCQFLLLSPSDIRHVLTTIAYRHRSSNAGIDFYVQEPTIEGLARLMLQLQMVQDWEVPLRHRCNTFLEVFGNSKIQTKTKEYVGVLSKKLIEFVYHGTGSLQGLVDLSQLKLRQKDELVEVFEYWTEKAKPFDVETLREYRLRNYYEDRYDFRRNLIDWDYTMNLKPIENASVVHIKQYREWRESGIAFEFGDQCYTKANNTMASYAETREKNRGSALRRGYWLDIVVGPYISWGLTCFQSNKYAEELFDVHNKGTGVEQNRHNTVEVSVFNVLSCLYEMETGQLYKMKKRNKIYSGIGGEEDEDGPKVEEIEETTDGTREKLNREDATRRAEAILKAKNNVKICLMVGKPSELLKKAKYQNKFHHAFVSSQQAHILDSSKNSFSFTQVLAKNAQVSVESSTFLLPLKQEQRIAYAEKVFELADNLKLKRLNKLELPNTISENELKQLDNAILSFLHSRME